jgi:hypothetical protein
VGYPGNSNLSNKAKSQNPSPSPSPFKERALATPRQPDAKHFQSHSALVHVLVLPLTCCVALASLCILGL